MKYGFLYCLIGYILVILLSREWHHQYVPNVYKDSMYWQLYLSYDVKAKKDTVSEKIYRAKAAEYYRKSDYFDKMHNP